MRKLIHEVDCYARSDSGNKIDKKTVHEVAHDMLKSAKAADLTYIADNKPGCLRKHNAKAFSYFDGNKKINEKISIERIKKLGIPPA